MKPLVILANLVLVAFAAMVVVTDGPPTEAIYIVFTLLLLAIPLFSVYALLRKSDDAAIARAAALCNVALVGFVISAFADQYPHPDESGFLPFVAICLAVPALNAVMLFGGRASRPQTAGHPAQP